MKSTKIKYKNLKDGNIQIIDIQNAASTKELRETFGEKIVTKYLCCKNKPKYFQSDRQIHIRFVGNDYLSVGQIINRERLDIIISIMRKAAERLIKIREEQENKIYTVEI